MDGLIPVAIKTSGENNVLPLGLLLEASILVELRHPNICQTNERMYIVTEWVSGGSLADYLQEYDPDLPDLYEIGAQFEDIRFFRNPPRGLTDEAVLEMVTHGYRMLKMQECPDSLYNLMLKCWDKDASARLTFKFLHFCLDLSSCWDRNSIRVFPVKWAAPETFMHGRVSTKSDVWSFGVLLTELVTHGCIPYPGMSNKDVMDEIQHGYRMPKMADCPQTLYKLMLNCWDKDPAARHTFEFMYSYLDHCFVSTKPDC
ncbi:tyrosine-protein kinase Fyn-like [Patiria miniata]|uniref:Protein kinase domain-containing protein n=1 Tax=Patiria miniata TaxID=46514 RepID=A0A914BC10_PATMI|nr:tyrosine-protein kinase Fyn-like [Patiria miniata]